MARPDEPQAVDPSSADAPSGDQPPAAATSGSAAGRSGARRLSRAEAERVFELASRTSGEATAAADSRLSAATILSVAREVGLPEDAVRAALLEVTAARGDLSGRSLGRYQLVRHLGTGAGGSVYLAHDPQLGRDLALKVFAGSADDSAGIYGRFVREAKALARIHHPHVVGVFDMGQSDGLAYLAMELAPGGALDGFLKPETPPAFEAFLRRAGAKVPGDDRPGRIDGDVGRRWLREAVLGLREAASHGLLHRDVKPSNLLLDDKGHLKVADFGLAKLVAEADSTLTRQGEVLGTPLYMSPEQVRGHSLDARSDIYALGATFFHLLAGRPPFLADAAPAVVMARRLVDEPPALASVAPTVPADLAAIVDRMIRRDVEARFASYDEILAALDGGALMPSEAGRGDGDGAPTVATGSALTRWRRRWRGRTGVVVHKRTSASPHETNVALAKALALAGFDGESAGRLASHWRWKGRAILAEVSADPEGSRIELRCATGPRRLSTLLATTVGWGLLALITGAIAGELGGVGELGGWTFWVGAALGTGRWWTSGERFLRRAEAKLREVSDAAERALPGRS